jgi:glycerol uptake facilitator-like aquaporin
LLFKLADICNSTHLQRGISAAQGVFIEMFITAALVLTVLMLAVEKHTITPFAPVRFFFFPFSTAHSLTPQKK